MPQNLSVTLYLFLYMLVMLRTVEFNLRDDHQNPAECALECPEFNEYPKLVATIYSDRHQIGQPTDYGHWRWSDSEVSMRKYVS